jgi:hypothetical protein
MGSVCEKDSAVKNPDLSAFVAREKGREIATRLGITQRLQRIIEAEVWPPHPTAQELNEIIPQVRQRAQDFMNTLRSLKRGEYPGSWDEAYGTACGRLYEYPGIYSIGPICNGDREYPTDNLDSFVWAQASWAAVEAVFWELSPPPEKPTDNNLFLAFFGLHELGASRVNFCLVDGQERLVVDIPLGGEHEGEVACLAFGDHEPGDQEIRYVHGPWEPCSENRLIGSYKREIVVHPPSDEPE